MPVYNRAAVVRRAIDSVLAQDFRDFEMIVVDDGSTDGTPDSVRAVDDPRIRLIVLSPNGGSNAARNAGIRASSAPLIAFLDSDDAFLPHKLGAVVRRFANDPGLDLLVDSFTKLLPAGARKRQIDRINDVIDDQQKFRRALFTRRLWKATPAISVRRDAAIRAGLFDESLRRLQDFDFLVRASAEARCAATDQILWVKHATDDAISAQGDTLIRAYIELAERHPQILENRSYRPGMARDVSRQIRHYLRRGRLLSAGRDIGRLARAFGWRTTATLLREGQRGLPQL